MWNSVKHKCCIHYSCAWEQKNEIRQVVQNKYGRSEVGTTLRSFIGLAIARAYVTLGSLLPGAVGELPN